MNDRYFKLFFIQMQIFCDRTTSNTVNQWSLTSVHQPTPFPTPGCLGPAPTCVNTVGLACNVYILMRFTVECSLLEMNFVAIVVQLQGCTKLLYIMAYGENVFCGAFF